MNDCGYEKEDYNLLSVSEDLILRGREVRFMKAASDYDLYKDLVIIAMSRMMPDTRTSIADQLILIHPTGTFYLYELRISKRYNTITNINEWCPKIRYGIA